ncbi:MAG: hypothetical protein EBU81_13430, partial [Proteobacteria bacterium]|nr:hypothetical protein [Pseudomonadota bacterium]
SVSATSAAAPAYQWRRNGVPVPGATGPVFSIGSARLEDAGRYDVLLENGGGAITSAEAQLRILGVPVPRNGLLSHHRFAGGMGESSGGSDMLFVSIPPLLSSFPSDTAFSSSASFGVDRFGQQNRALVFDGVSKNYARLPAPIPASVANDFTISLWALGEGNKPTAFFGGNILLMPTHGSVNYGGGHAAVGLLMNQSQVAVTAHSDNYAPVLISGDVQVGKWHQIVVSSIAKVVRLYVDGVLVGSQDLSASGFTFHPSAGDPYVESEFWIPEGGGIGGMIGYADGISPGITYRGFKGSVGDFRIYGRGLSTAEVQALFAAEFSGDSSNLPLIISHPAATSASSGGSVTMTVTASSLLPLSYQWRKGGVAISGATAASYTIASVAAADAGSYDVVVANASGAIVSNVAGLTVNAAAYALRFDGTSGYVSISNDLFGGAIN